MGQRFGTRKNSYLQAITFSNEQFALMILDDWWELWERLAEQRLEKHKKQDLAQPREEGTKKPNRVDEDDQRQLDRTCHDAKADKVPGSNLTRYSMWGKYCPDKKGFGDGYPVILCMNQSLGGDRLPLRRSPAMVQMRKRICDCWWGTYKYTGPKRKKEILTKILTVQRHINMCPMNIIDEEADEEQLYNTQEQCDMDGDADGG